MVAVGIGLQLLAPRKRQKERVSEREREKEPLTRAVESWWPHYVPPKNMMKCRVLEMQQLMLMLLLLMR